MGLYDSYAYVHLGVHKKNSRYCNQRIQFLLAKFKTSLSYVIKGYLPAYFSPDVSGPFGQGQCPGGGGGTPSFK